MGTLVIVKNWGVFQDTKEQHCHTLTLKILIILCVWLGQGVTRVGKSMFSISLFLAVCVFPNQRQLSIVVSDWGSYIGCRFPFGFGGILFSV